MAAPTQKPKINNSIPKPPNKSINFQSYPSDLLADGRNFYSQFLFVDYQNASAGLMGGAGTGGMVLPLPNKINDYQTVVWEQNSLVDLAGQAAYGIAQGIATYIGGRAGPVGAAVGGSAAGAIISAVGGIAGGVSGIGGWATGYALNPQLVLLFKSPNFKEFTMEWLLTANNPQESEAIARIINYFKFNMLPSHILGGTGYKYPNIAIVNFFPDDYMFKFKPCAVIAVSSDYSGAGQPAFFKDNAPVAVRLTVQLKEIELWSQDTFAFNL